MADDGLDPAAYLSHDCIVEIFSGLPAKHLCRLKCVCRSWRDLISGPVHRLRLARTDAASGFLYHRLSSWAWKPAFTALKFTALCPPAVGGGSGSPAAPPLVDPAFPFLPRYTLMRLLDSCNGLLLLRYATDDDPPLDAPCYVVCNPGTRSWVELSPGRPVHENHNHAPGLHAPGADAALAGVTAHGLVPLKMEWALPAALAFDPAVSSHFHVIELLGGNTLVKEVRIYSSETREWIRRNTQWWHVDDVAYAGKHAYLNGFLHLATTTAIGVVVASVDAAGETWRTTRVCDSKMALGGPGAIGQCQRRLLYADVDADADAAGSGELSVYALEHFGLGAEQWVLKHRAMSSLDPSGKEVWFGKRHSVVGIHPDCAVLFLFDSRRRSLIAYDMDSGTIRSVHIFTVSCRKYRFFPYIPLYSQ